MPNLEGKPICPVCNARESKLLHKYTVERSASHFCTNTRNPDRHARLLGSLRRLWPDGYCHVYECTNCGFGYGWPHVGGDEEFYSILHEEHGYPMDRWEYQKTIDLCSRDDTDSEINRVLDIGAGNGRFLEQMPNRWEKFAIEGSETTRDLLRRSGIKVFKSLDEAQTASWQFSLITMFQVLEHIADFRYMLLQCKNVIAQDGHLSISVPLGSSKVDQERLTGCADMPPNHINRWTPKSLTRALQNAGFNVERTLNQPSSLSAFRYAIYLGVLSKAQQPGSLASQIYKIRNRKIRASLLPLPGLVTGMRLIPNWRILSQGESFMIIASPAP